MDVSPSSNNDMNALQVNALQKAIDLDQRAAFKIMETAMEESKKITAQKIGIGSNLNIAG